RNTIQKYADQDTRIIFVKNEHNEGIGAVRAKGLALARGKYMACLDADDVAMPERLAKQIAFLDTHPAVAALGTWAEQIDEHGTVVRVKKKPLTNTEMRFESLLWCPIINTTVMVRTEIICTVGGYNSDFRGAEDYELWSRLLAANYELANLQEPLSKFRT